MKRFPSEIEIIELNIKLIDRMQLIQRLLLHLVMVLVVVDMNENMGDPVEELKVLVRVVVLVGLVVVLVADNAQKTEAIDCPLQHALALLHQMHALQQSRQLDAPQLDHAHVVHPLQLLDELSDGLLRDVDVCLLCRCVIHEVLLLLVGWLSILALSRLEYGVDHIEQLVEGHVVPLGDEAVEIGIEVLYIKQLIAIDLPTRDDILDAVLDLDEVCKPQHVFYGPVDLALLDESDLLAQFEDVGLVEFALQDEAHLLQNNHHIHHSDDHCRCRPQMVLSSLEKDCRRFRISYFSQLITQKSSSSSSSKVVVYSEAGWVRKASISCMRCLVSECSSLTSFLICQDAAVCSAKDTSRDDFSARSLACSFSRDCICARYLSSFSMYSAASVFRISSVYSLSSLSCIASSYLSTSLSKFTRYCWLFYSSDSMLALSYSIHSSFSLRDCSQFLVLLLVLQMR